MLFINQLKKVLSYKHISLYYIYEYLLLIHIQNLLKLNHFTLNIILVYTRYYKILNVLHVNDIDAFFLLKLYIIY